MSKPLEGIKVVEIAQEIQGPFASLVLADMGADVVKVENKETGDFSRWMLTALIGGPDVKNATVSHYFIAMNRGKRSITADLKKPDAIEMVRRMIKSYDVLRHQLPARRARPARARLRRCAQDQSAHRVRAGKFVGAARAVGDAAEPRHARAGGERGDGEDRDAVDPPLAAGMFIADHSGALSLASGVLAALFARERTGKGQKVDASIYGTMIAMQGMEINYTSITGVEPERAGRGHQFLRGVWGAFPTRDGYICIAGVDEKRWPSFCKIVGIQHLETDPEYSDNVVRNFHGEKIQKVLDEIFPNKTSKEWLKELTDADILATEVVDYRTMLKSEQARVNGYLLELDHPVAGKVLVSGTPITINGEVTTTAEAAPEHGQHTEEVLLELGYTWEEIGALRDSGAV